MHFKNAWNNGSSATKDQYRTSLIQTGAKLDELEAALNTVESKKAFCDVVTAEKDAILREGGAEAAERVLDAGHKSMSPYPSSPFHVLFDFLRSAQGVSDEDIGDFETIYDEAAAAWQRWECLPDQFNPQLPPVNAIDISVLYARLVSLSAPTTETVVGSSAESTSPTIHGQGKSPHSLEQSDSARKARSQKALWNLEAHLNTPYTLDFVSLVDVLLSPAARRHFGENDEEHVETEANVKSPVADPTLLTGSIPNCLESLQAMSRIERPSATDSRRSSVTSESCLVSRDVDRGN
ncbi:hypothetical protein QFC21_003044 [Naganishia friedmannii]|uniref:Uncharacterized protein n=1 Tax=Naganishia friedmannii TaxID=89922 RepID=A0ACC2VRF6_9TREE|nr:hypothetical protein QFC21_003044 [Naganishia friedmannii]